MVNYISVEKLKEKIKQSDLSNREKMALLNCVSEISFEEVKPATHIPMKYLFPILEEPGTCGACKYFRRQHRKNGDLRASGKCIMKPELFKEISQRMVACKTYYEQRKG